MINLVFGGVCMGNLQKPGEKPDKPGEYLERGPYGGKVSKPRQVTIEPGDEKLPPTQKPNRKWKWIGKPKRN
ncbi:YjzC family protein [Niabella digestorum]|jgi:hypothetical protein|uniref:YjzC family protein n=1 Tax=Niabella digestorum TaxID=3117701 RepID=A0ABU7RFC3_9BACT